MSPAASLLVLAMVPVSSAPSIPSPNSPALVLMITYTTISIKQIENMLYAAAYDHVERPSTMESVKSGMASALVVVGLHQLRRHHTVMVSRLRGSPVV